MQFSSSPQNSQSQNECYSTNEEYFLDICRFGQFEEIKQFIESLNLETKFDWEWTSNSGDNFVHMLAGNNFPDIFEYLMNVIKQRGMGQKVLALINKQNSTGNTPLHYTVITSSKEMLIKLLKYGTDPSITNEFNRTALDEAEMIQQFQLAQILAPVTKQDIETLKKQFETMDVCDEDSSESNSEEQKEKEEKKQKIIQKEEKE